MTSFQHLRNGSRRRWRVASIVLLATVLIGLLAYAVFGLLIRYITLD